MAEGNGGNSAETSQEVERDFKLTALVNQLKELATKISDVETSAIAKGAFGEKPFVTESTRQLTESTLDLPFYAPLNLCCTVPFDEKTHDHRQ
uniref:Uncharacterized protein n=1 Tax=Solanum tuberosum TaxID=4113 RepID=M1DW65_SOLTU